MKPLAPSARLRGSPDRRSIAANDTRSGNGTDEHPGGSAAVAARGALVADADVLQLGEREELDADYAYPEIKATLIERLPVRDVLRKEVPETVEHIADWARRRRLARIWLHVDIDVLDQTVLPAVDCPGSPGLDFDQLAALLAGVLGRVSVIGLDVTIFDPELDADGILAKKLVRTLALLSL